MEYKKSDLSQIHHGVAPVHHGEEDKKELESLGFFISDEYGYETFQSFRFGSA